MGWWFDGSVGIEQIWWGILDKYNIHSFRLCMISGNRDEAWPMYLVWPISECFMLGWSGGTLPAHCHWLNTGRVNGLCPIMSVLTQSYQRGTWFVCSTVRELAVSNLCQLLFYLSITWSRCRNAYWNLWILTIALVIVNTVLPVGKIKALVRKRWEKVGNFVVVKEWQPFNLYLYNLVSLRLYTGGDCVFAPVRMPPPPPAADFCSCNNFWTTFCISFIFGRINDLIRFWLIFGMTLSLNFQGQIWNLFYLCHETKSKHIDWTLGPKCDHQIWPWPWPWPLIFKVKYGIAIPQPKMVRLLRNKKQTYWLNCRPWMCQLDLSLTMTLTLNFQGQIRNLLYLSQKLSNCHETKSKHTVCTLGFKCDHEILPWPWP